METLSSTPYAADTPEKLEPLNPSERKAFADLAATSQPTMQVAPRTMLRLLAQVAAQEQQLLLHERREKGLRASAETWLRHEGYEDEAQEVLDVLNDPHYGDPAYQEPDMEHDGTGWVAPRPLRNDIRGLAS